MSEDAERIIGIYDRKAAFWDKDRLRILFEKSWLDKFLALVPIGSIVASPFTTPASMKRSTFHLSSAMVLMWSRMLPTIRNVIGIPCG